MQWPPTRPGVNGRKFHLVRAAASTSPVSMPSAWKIIDNSFISAMLRSRCVFSMHLGGLGHLDRGRPVHAGRDHGAVNRGDDIERLLVLAGDDLSDRLEPVRACRPD